MKKKRERSSRLQSAFRLRDEDAREEALLEILDLVQAGEEEIQNGIDELIFGLGRERSTLVLSSVWYKLSQLGPQKELKTFAEKELDSPNADHRRHALSYLSAVYKEDGEILFKKMEKDSDPWVLYEAGYTILNLNPRLAVDLWLQAQRIAPVVLADEVLPNYIGQYADEDVIDRLKIIISKDPNDHLTLLDLRVAETWNSIDYLDSKSPVSVGEGYIINCPNCNSLLGIRDGHVGERARCRLCKHEFVIPQRSEE
jgi:hypothetical protein